MKDFDMELTQKFAMQYAKANKKEKSNLLDEYCNLAYVKRNTAAQRIRRVRRAVYPGVLKTNRYQKKRGPKRIFTNRHKFILKLCWKQGRDICAERLYPQLRVYIKQLQKHTDNLDFYNKEEIDKVKNISLISCKRIIADFPKEKRSKSKKAEGIYSLVPVEADFSRQTKRPGNLEIDYVEHNGGSARGSFAISGNYVDIATGWISRATSLNKSLSSVEYIHSKALSKIYHIPRKFHPDNARTILKHLYAENDDMAVNPMKFSISRSRPYEKNDNPHVEQKNDDKIRKLVGYYRFDKKEQVNLLNEVYDIADLIDNFFSASAKLKFKVKRADGKTIKRIHSKPKTPYRRLMLNRHLDKETKGQLRTMYNGLNLVELNTKLDKKLKDLVHSLDDKQYDLTG